jgi:hypothetical protein
MNSDDSESTHWVDKLISEMEVNPVFSIGYVCEKMAEMIRIDAKHTSQIDEDEE